MINRLIFGNLLVFVVMSCQSPTKGTYDPLVVDTRSPQWVDSVQVYRYLMPLPSLLGIKVSNHGQIVYNQQYSSTPKQINIPLTMHKAKKDAYYQIEFKYPKNKKRLSRLNLANFKELIIYSPQGFTSWQDSISNLATSKDFVKAVAVNWGKATIITWAVRAALQNLFSTLEIRPGVPDDFIIKHYPVDSILATTQQVYKEILTCLTKMPCSKKDQAFITQLRKKTTSYRITRSSIHHLITTTKKWSEILDEYAVNKFSDSINIVKLSEKFNQQSSEIKKEWLTQLSFAHQKLFVMVNSYNSSKLYKQLVETWVQLVEGQTDYLEIIMSKDGKKVKKAHLHTLGGKDLASQLLHNGRNWLFDVNSFQVPKVLIWERYPSQKFNLDKNNQVEASQRSGKAYKELQKILDQGLPKAWAFTGDKLPQP